MSTIFSPAAHRPIAGSGFFTAARKALKRWWLAYLAQRIERAAVLQLRSMSDRELKDIGVSRSQIEFAVRGDFERDRSVSPYR